MPSFYIVRDDEPSSPVRSNPWRPLSRAFNDEREATDSLPQYARLFGPVRVERRDAPATLTDADRAQADDASGRG
jgi:hypothetical protein